MSRRVVFSAGTVKMAPAGLDALTASNAQLLFSADGAPYNGCWLTGKIPSGAFSETSQGVTGGTRYTRTASLGFGKTFGAPPRVMVGIIDPNSGCFTPNGYFSSAGFGSVSGQSTGSALIMTYAVSTTALTVAISYVYFSGNGFNRFLDVPFIIFQA